MPRLIRVAALAAMAASMACVDTSTVAAFACGGDADCAQGSACCEGFCRVGGCGEAECQGGQRCGGACVDTRSDAKHCGRCGAACVGAEACVDGSCLGPNCGDGTECGDGMVCVSGTCREVACLGVSCNAYSTCLGGACVPRACTDGLCPPGSACVEDACVDVGCVGVVCPGGAACAQGRCDGQATCANGALDGDESDVDCGGACTPCVDGKLCGAPPDCASGSCEGGRCAAGCQDGATCGDNPGAPCRLGALSCDEAGNGTCVDALDNDDGLVCGDGRICLHGACTACVDGAACNTNPDGCLVGVVSCSPAVACENGTARRAAGSRCGEAQVCNTQGVCTACNAGAACTGNPGGPCITGEVSCDTGEARCVDKDEAPTGLSCGTGKICRAGACVDCAQGQACATNPSAPCRVGTITCGASTSCDDGANAPAGTNCGEGQVCNGNGQCVSCDAGAACTTNPGGACVAGIISCGTGAPTCIDDAQKSPGTSCGLDKVCNAAGACVTCTASQECGTNPSACRTGKTSCATGATTCVDDGNQPPGTSCGAGQVCDGNGFCGACTAGQACTGNPGICKTGKTACGTGATTCVDDVNQPAGTSCGNGKVCNGSGACVACTADQACGTNPSPCRTGKTSCATGAQTCVDSGNVPAGTGCGTNQVCNGSGACVSCTAGAACTNNPSPCRTGATSCATGAQQCIDSGNKSAGTSCGTGQVCNGAGACVACTQGAPCSTNPSAACFNGITSCNSGAPVCIDDTPRAAGTSCGSNKVCNSAGACVSCVAGQACSGNPNAACRNGVTACNTGAPVCEDAGPKDAGTTCGSNKVCNGSGACVSCVAGQACSGNPNAACRNGVTSCATGAQACADGTPKAAGTSCGSNQVCDGSGYCGACTAGQTCGGNPSACRKGVTSCTTGTTTCVDGTPQPAGTSCGTNQVCNGSGTCVACVAGVACPTNPGICRTGTTTCGSGGAECIDSGNKPAGTSCGTNQVCNGSGSCVACAAGQTCSSNPNPCVKGTTSCSTGASVCQNTTQPVGAGTSCGAGKVCDGSGACVACISGQACAGNPDPCKQGVTSCTTGASVCVNGANKAAGTSCGSDKVCNASGQCVACTAGLGCSTNPNAPCQQGVTSCATGAQTCVNSGASAPVGTPCSGGSNSGVCDAYGECSVWSCPQGCIDQGGWCMPGNDDFACGQPRMLCTTCAFECMCSGGLCVRRDGPMPARPVCIEPY